MHPTNFDTWYFHFHSGKMLSNFPIDFFFDQHSIHFPNIGAFSNYLSALYFYLIPLWLGPFCMQVTRGSENIQYVFLLSLKTNSLLSTLIYVFKAICIDGYNNTLLPLHFLWPCFLFFSGKRCQETGEDGEAYVARVLISLVLPLQRNSSWMISWDKNQSACSRKLPLLLTSNDCSLF